ncbi:uncharacterized protein LOC115541699 [Gadus morhua]|uniref:uncharacterized protein LOC115541699 n=1 Tax=Gadus morhua TaxID=8049 RepID=UPI0011B84864|nr:uncharacterized protein LOC115541699 [Gadus morhua]
MATAAYINRNGGVRSEQLLSIARQQLCWAHTHLLSIRAANIAEIGQRLWAWQLNTLMERGLAFSIVKTYADAVSSCHEGFGDKTVFSHPLMKRFLKADHRVCAFHFRPEDYLQSTSHRKKCPKRLHLKRAAVPTLCGPTLDEEDLGAVGGVVDQPSTSSISLVLTSPQPRPHQSNKSPRKSLSGSYLAFPVIRERLSLSPDDCETEMLQMDTSISSVIEDDPKDMSFSLSQQSSSSETSSSSASEEQGEWDERKWIVNESSIMQLFRTCHICAAQITDKKVTKLFFFL